MLRTTLLTLACLLASQASAADLTLLVGYQANDNFELSDSVNAFPNGQDLGEPGDDVDLGGGTALSVALDFVFNNEPNSRIGLFVTRHEGEFESSAGLEDSKMEVTHVHFTAMNYYPSGNWEPFVLAGIGAGIFSPEDNSLDDDTLFSAQIAGGANYKISENMLLRFEARWIPTFFNGSASGICSGGCTIALKSDMYNQFQANVGLQFRF